MMKQVQHSRVVESVMEALLQSLQKREWTQRIPGSRTLASRFAVSQPTVCVALARLRKMGYLTGGERRAYRVSNSFPARCAEPDTGRPAAAPKVVIFSPSPVPLLDSFTRELLESLERKLRLRGHAVQRYGFDFRQVDTAREEWDALLGREDSLIAVQASPSLLRWAESRNIRIVCLGEFFWGREGIHMHSVEMVRTAVRRLVGIGHRQIVIPIGNRANSLMPWAQQVLQEELEAAGHSFHAPNHLLEFDQDSPESLRAMLERRWNGSFPPTALVLRDFREFLVAFCLLWERGIRIPEDCSVVLLGNMAEEKWFVPHLAHFRFPAKRMVNALFCWATGDAMKSKEWSFPATFTEGNSIAPPKARPACLDPPASRRPARRHMPDCA